MKANPPDESSFGLPGSFNSTLVKQEHCNYTSSKHSQEKVQVNFLHFPSLRAQTPKFQIQPAVLV